MVNEYESPQVWGEPPEQIDEWFVNYAEGCPNFAPEVKADLLALKDETRWCTRKIYSKITMIYAVLQ